MPSLSGELIMGLLGLLMAYVGGCRVWVTPKHCIIKKPQLSSVMSQESCTPELLTYPPRPRRYLLRERVEAQARLGVLPALLLLCPQGPGVTCFAYVLIVAVDPGVL